jgi:hypothetical protein
MLEPLAYRIVGIHCRQMMYDHTEEAILLLACYIQIVAWYEVDDDIEVGNWISKLASVGF